MNTGETMMKQHKIMWTMSACALVGGVVTWAASQPDMPQEESRQALVVRPQITIKTPVSSVPWQTMNDQENTPSGCDFTAGQRSVYSIHASETGEVTSGPMMGVSGQEPIAFRSMTTATLEVAVVDVDEDRALLQGRYQAVRASQVLHDDELERPFLFHVDRHCQVQGFAHHRDTAPSYARIQQAMLAQMSWRMPDDLGAPLDYQDSTGQYVSTLHQAHRTGELRITRSADTFTPWGFEGIEEMTGMKHAHLRVYRPDRDASVWFDAMEFEATLHSEHATLDRAMRVTRRPRQSQRAWSAGPLELYIWADLLPMNLPLKEDLPPTKQELALRERLKALPLETVVHEFEALSDEGRGIQDAWPVMQAYLEARPEQADALVDRLGTEPIEQMARMTAYVSLGFTRTPEAKHALERVMTDTQSHPNERSRAMIALIGRPDTGIELAQIIVEQTDTQEYDESVEEHIMARQSLLALGAMAGMKPDDAEIRALAERTILEALSRLTNPHNKRPAYHALANIGDPALLIHVKDAVNHPHWQMRSAAATITRRMPPSESARFTADWLKQETSPVVKYHLYRTLNKQTYDASEMTSREVLELAIKDLRHHRSALIRRHIVELLGRAARLDEFSDLPIEQAMLEILPFELRRESGLYTKIARQVDATHLRETLAAYQRGEFDEEIAREFKLDRGASELSEVVDDNPYQLDPVSSQHTTEQQ